MNTRILPTVLLVFLCGVGLGLLYFFYLSFEPFKPPTLTPNLIPILNTDKTIKNGETISTALNYCIYKKVSSVTTRRIESIGEDRRVYFLSTTVSAGMKPGCSFATSNTLPISSDIPPGKYKIILVSQFKVNQLKEVSVTYETEEFQVIKPE